MYNNLMVAGFSKKQKKKGAWHQLLLVIFLGIPMLALIIFLGISDIRIYKNRRAVDSELNNFKQQIEVLQQQNAALKQGLGDVSQENFKEEKMRDQGYKKPGEEVWAIIGQNSQNTKNQPSSENNFWQNIFNKIKNFGQLPAEEQQ